MPVQIPMEKLSQKKTQIENLFKNRKEIVYKKYISFNVIEEKKEV